MKRIFLAGCKVDCIDSLDCEEITDVCKKVYPEDEYDTEYTCNGLMDRGNEVIYVSSDLFPKEKMRVLIHEVAELMNYYGELELEESHSKIVSLDRLLLDFIINNKSVIKEVWEVYK